MNRCILLAVLLIGLSLAGCVSEEKQDDGKVNIVTTIGMITDMVERIGGDRVSVQGFMGPGVDPHLYKASEGDVTRMADADLIIYNGLHLEGAMSEVLDQMHRRVKTVAVTKDFDRSLLLGHPTYENAHDPHVWFDVSLWMRTIPTIQQALTETDS
ncbi:MAG: zinc ABC transporter substrate-binding protein, partial [candidate division Zixibacteria bacterium]|nr:zinc ABC transporter substrate-binding protein [candidate division Zixibacteria bacterium]